MSARDYPAFSTFDGLVKTKLSTTPKCTLPDSQATPAEICQFQQLALIAMAIAKDFLSPKFRARRWQSEKVTVMPMPKASVDENQRLVSRKNQVWLSGEAGMKPISKAIPMQPMP